MGFLELQSYAAGILDNSPAIQGVYITLMCFVLLGRASKSWFLWIAVYLWGLLCQLLDEFLFAAVEAAVEVSPHAVTGGGSMQLHCILNASC